MTTLATLRSAHLALATKRRSALTTACALLLVLGGSACLGSPHRARHAAELGPAVSIPIELYRGRYVFCHGRVDGREVEMLLDSGAGVTVLSEALAAELQLDDLRDGRVQGVGGRQAARWADGVRLELGNLTLSDLRVAILDLSEIGCALGRELPVILGREVFTSCVVDVDPARATLTLSDPRSFTYEGPGATLPLIGGNGGWITIVRANGGEPFQVDVDTGSGGNLTVFGGLAREVGLLAADLPPPTDFTLGVGGRNPVRSAALDSLELGGYALQDVPIQVDAGPEGNAQNGGAFATSSAGGNLGAGVLHRFRTIFDTRRRHLHLEPGPGFAQAFPTAPASASTCATARWRSCAWGPGLPPRAAAGRSGSASSPSTGSRSRRSAPRPASGGSTRPPEPP